MAKLTLADIKIQLKDRGLKATKQRVAVAQVLAQANQPIGVKEIYQEISKHDKVTGIATVYRVLSLLVDVGIIQRNPSVSRESSHYQMADTKTGQVVCSRCGKVEYIDIAPELEALRTTVSKRSKFATTDQSLYIIADCRNIKCN